LTFAFSFINPLYEYSATAAGKGGMRIYEEEEAVYFSKIIGSSFLSFSLLHNDRNNNHNSLISLSLSLLYSA